ncbi:hypothetical protein D3C77_681140 [compost metagenome]
MLTTLQLKPIFAYELLVPVIALFRRAYLRSVIDMDQAEAARVSKRPLEIVHQRPGEIAFQIHAGFDRPAQLGNMALQKFDAADIVNFSIHHFVIVAGAVLGNVYRNRPKLLG